MEEGRGQEGFFGFAFVVVEEAGSVDVQPIGAAGVEMAAGVEVALSDDVGGGEVVDGFGG